MTEPSSIPEVAILLDTSEQWGRQIVRGILAYADRAGPWFVRVLSSKNFECLPNDLRADGIIAEVTSRRLAIELTESGIPVVNVSDVQAEGLMAPSVRSDDRATVQMAIEHFQERGLRNVAVVAPDQRAVQAEFIKLFKLAAAELHLTCNEFCIVNDRNVLIPALTTWIASLPKPCGVLVWGHSFGTTVVECCTRAGVPVPHDVAVLSGGYDEVLARASSPAVSGILQPTLQIGRKAAQQLTRMIRGDIVPMQISWLKPVGIASHPSTDTLAVSDPELAEVVRFLKTNACNPISIDDILTRFSYAKSTLERQFQRSLDCTPFELVRRLRINKARELLANSDLQLQKVAEACGYATQSYFTRVFKKETGQSPAEFRKANRA